MARGEVDGVRLRFESLSRDAPELSESGQIRLSFKRSSALVLSLVGALIRLALQRYPRTP